MHGFSKKDILIVVSGVLVVVLLFFGISYIIESNSPTYQHQELIKNIRKAAYKYGLKNLELFESNSEVYLTVDTLVMDGYLKSNSKDGYSYVDNLTAEPFGGMVYVYYDGKKVRTIYFENYELDKSNTNKEENINNQLDKLELNITEVTSKAISISIIGDDKDLIEKYDFYLNDNLIFSGNFKQYTFDNLTFGIYKIKVIGHNASGTVERNVVVSTKKMNTPKIIQKDNVVEINYSDNFADYLCEYKIDNNGWIQATSQMISLDIKKDITLVARISDGYNTISTKIYNLSYKDNSSNQVESLSLNYDDEYELYVGNSVNLIAYRNSNKGTIEEKVSWSTSDKSLATVSNGNVLAIKEGTAVITARSNDGLEASIKIIIKKLPSLNIELSNKEISLEKGATKKLSYTVNPNTTKNAVWSSSDPSVATVSSTGIVTAKSIGTTIISVTVDNVKATCKVIVYANPTVSYNTIINKVSTNIDSYNQLQEKVETIVTKNDVSITENLIYQWYLNDVKIDGATNRDYIISKYGTYKCKVYYNGNFISESQYTPNSSEISYTADTSDTKFVFVNNPEPISDSAFIDNGKIIYKTTFNKNLELYFEHNRHTATPFFYGIRIYNPTNQNVDLYINRSGSSACLSTCDYYSKTWEEYFTNNIVYRLNSSTGSTNLKQIYTLSPGQYLYLWLVKDTSMLGNTKFISTVSNAQYEPYDDYLTNNFEPIDSTWGWAFDGVLNLTAKVNGNYLSTIGDSLEVANVAISKAFYNSSNKNKINTASELTLKNGATLTGEYNGKPLVTNNVTFTIDDNTPKGNLITHFSSSTNSSIKNLASGWITNISGSNIIGAYQREILPLQGIALNGTKYIVRPFDSIQTANYSVRYLENITVNNKSSRARNVAFYINTASGTDQISADTSLSAFVTNNSLKIINSSYTKNGVKVYPTATFKVFSKRTNVQVWNATIPAGQSVTIPSISLMGGMSYATLIKFVCVDNSCYDAFYQKDFSW